MRSSKQPVERGSAILSIMKNYKKAAEKKLQAFGRNVVRPALKAVVKGVKRPEATGAKRDRIKYGG